MVRMFVSLVALIVLVFAAPTAQAQSLAQYAGCSGPDCSACNIAYIANGLIGWLIGFLFILFAVLMALAGFRLVTAGGNRGALDEAKDSFANALIGIIIVLSAWLIVDTVMRGLVGTTQNRGQLAAEVGTGGTVSGWLFWSDIQCYDQIDPTNAGEFIPEPDPEIPTAPIGGGTGIVDLPPGVSAGPGRSAIVAYAIAMDNRQCQYSQANRNNCRGNPGYTDCSELVHHAYLSAGCRSPGSWTGTISQNARPIGDPRSLRTGDLIVRRANGEGHVVICMNDGCGTVIHARGRGAPDGRPARIPVADQITTSGGSYYYTQSGAQVVRAALWCPTGSGGTGPQ